jgi:hypothetical protein
MGSGLAGALFPAASAVPAAATPASVRCTAAADARLPRRCVATSAFSASRRYRLRGAASPRLRSRHCFLHPRPRLRRCRLRRRAYRGSRPSFRYFLFNAEVKLWTLVGVKRPGWWRWSTLSTACQSTVRFIQTFPHPSRTRPASRPATCVFTQFISHPTSIQLEH